MSDTKQAEDLSRVMSWIRDFRRWSTNEKIDPYVIRQAIIMMFEADTFAALAQGVNTEELQTFDDAARDEARKLNEQLLIKLNK